MTRFVTIILYLGLAFSRDQEFLYSTLIDTSFENNPFSWTDAVYKIDAQGLNIEYLIPSRSKIEDVFENQSTILFTSEFISRAFSNNSVEQFSKLDDSILVSFVKQGPDTGPGFSEGNLS